jgi:Flp pilus assembly protein TadG
MKIVSRKRRRSDGATIVLVAIVAFFIMLPLGLLAFEVSRLYLAQNQLQNAVDSAALSAIVGMQDPDLINYESKQLNLANVTDIQAIKHYSFRQFTRNSITSISLASNSNDTGSVDANQASGQATYDLTLDKNTDQVTARAAFGLQPAFGGWQFLNLGTVTIRAKSVAGHKTRGPKEVVICVDISDSIKGGCGINRQSTDGATSKSLRAVLHSNLAGTVPKYSFTRVTRKNKIKGAPPVTIAVPDRYSNAPTSLHVGGNFIGHIAEPDLVFGTKTKADPTTPAHFPANPVVDPEHPVPTLYKKFLDKMPASFTQADKREALVALLSASKRGWLNNAASYNDIKAGNPNKAKDTILGTKDFFGYPAVPAKGKQPARAAIPGALNGDASTALGNDYRAAFQEAALQFVHPLEDEKRDARKLIRVLKKLNPKVKIALVGFAPQAGGHTKKGKPPGPETGNFGSNYTYGNSCLTKSAAKKLGVKPFSVPYIPLSDSDDVEASLDVCTTAAGTNTADALNVAHAVLTEADHNLDPANGPQMVILLSDGIPTSGGYIRAANKLGKEGIPVCTVGYVHIGYSAGGGPRILNKIASHGGLGGHYIEAAFKSDVYHHNGKGSYTGYYIKGTPGPDFDQSNESDKRLSKIFDGPPVLVNNIINH